MSQIHIMDDNSDLKVQGVIFQEIAASGTHLLKLFSLEVLLMHE